MEQEILTTGEVGIRVLREDLDALLQVLHRILGLAQALVGDREQDEGLLAKLNLMGVRRVLGFDHPPQLADGLLQVALVQVRNRPVEDRVGVIGIHAIEHLSKDLDSLVELL